MTSRLKKLTVHNWFVHFDVNDLECLWHGQSRGFDYALITVATRSGFPNWRLPISGSSDPDVDISNINPL